jgi:hypothetical protein
MPAPQDVKGVAIGDVTVQGFDWNWDDACGSAALAMFAQITLEGTGDVSLDACGDPLIYPGSDPLNQFGPYVTADGWSNPSSSGVTVTVSIPKDLIKPAYASLAVPYDCDLVIQTNGGARRVKIPGFVTVEDPAALAAKLAAEQVACVTLADALWSATHHYQPWWSVDPGPEGVDVAHLWRVAVRGLGTGDVITLNDPRGQVLGTVQAGAQGLATIGVVAAPVAGGPELDIGRQAGAAGRESPLEARGAAAGGRRRLMIGQTPLVHSARLPFGRRVVRLWAGPLGGTLAVFAITDEGWHDLYAVSNPRLPTLMRRVSVPGLRGVTSWAGGGFVMWGEFGVEPLTSRGRCRSPRRRGEGCLSQAPVLDLADYGAQLYALRDGGVDVYDASSKKVGELALPAGGAGHLAVVRRSLVVGDRRGLTVFSLDSPTEPRRVGALEVAGLASLEQPPLVVASTAVLVPLGRGAEVVDLSNPAQPRALGHYAEVPWYSGTALIGTFLARTDQQGYDVDLYRVGRTLTMG